MSLLEKSTKDKIMQGGISTFITYTYVQGWLIPFWIAKLDCYERGNTCFKKAELFFVLTLKLFQNIGIQDI